MVNPKTEKDFVLLLDEALSELDNLSVHLKQITYRCEQNRGNNENN
jgi:ABC-type bacteriocin/lantibiotic exporter with double-glycine peptidase domain